MLVKVMLGIITLCILVATYYIVSDARQKRAMENEAVRKASEWKPSPGNNKKFRFE